MNAGMLYPSPRKRSSQVFGKNRISTLTSRDLSNCKESNLHALQHTHDAKKDYKNDHGNPGWNTVPHGSLVVEQSFHGNGKREAKNCKRNQTTFQKKDILENV